MQIILNQNFDSWAWAGRSFEIIKNDTDIAFKLNCDGFCMASKFRLKAINGF